MQIAYRIFQSPSKFDRTMSISGRCIEYDRYPYPCLTGLSINTHTVTAKVKNHTAAKLTCSGDISTRRINIVPPSPRHKKASSLGGVH